jgi:hypothetical protein
MIERRERPRCRKVLEELLIEKDCSLEELIRGWDGFSISDGLKIQARRMIDEREDRSKAPTHN